MEINNWDIIAKDLAQETSAEEKSFINDLRKKDPKFDLDYSDSEKIWNSINKTPTSFDKERIIYIRDSKIKRAEKKHRGIIISAYIKYAAIFIGLLSIFFFAYDDITSQEFINAETAETHIFPDGSKITMQNGAVVSYNNSLIMGFNRDVNIVKGTAFFEINKYEGKKFIVKTKDYCIKVWGTKFVVNCAESVTRVTLNEGKIELEDYAVEGIANIMMKPGEEVVFGAGMSKPIKQSVNANVANYWTQKSLDFDNYSLSDLKQIFRIYYHKELIIEEGEVQMSNVGGSAPVDDVELIVKALSKVFKKELILNEDSIILK